MSRQRVLLRMQNLGTPFGCGLGLPHRETYVEMEGTRFEKVGYARLTAPTLIVSPQIVGVVRKTSWASSLYP